jgi:hypothetical protein
MVVIVKNVFECSKNRTFTICTRNISPEQQNTISNIDQLSPQLVQMKWMKNKMYV